MKTPAVEFRVQECAHLRGHAPHEAIVITPELTHWAAGNIGDLRNLLDCVKEHEHAIKNTDVCVLSCYAFSPAKLSLAIRVLALLSAGFIASTWTGYIDRNAWRTVTHFTGVYDHEK